MKIQELSLNHKKQKDFFYTHKTKDVKFRIHALKTLKSAILKYEDRIYDALYKDLHKSKFEAYASEIGITLDEINLHIKKIKRWAKPKRVGTPQLVHFWSSSFIYHQPYGQILIIAPWNYPFQLLMEPLIGAISTGNCVTLKPSQYTSNIAKVMEEMIREFFDEDYIAFYQGGREANQALLNEKWDYIFFTGSPVVGKIVMEKAAKNLTPVSLELGGKSPVIVDKDANIKLAAKRIAWGKFLNAGQTCIAPDYLLVHKDVKNEFLEKFVENIKLFFGNEENKSESYPRISTEKNIGRLSKLINNANIYYGGEYHESTKYFSPTILINVKSNSEVMKEEIFGPILPVLEFDELTEVIDFVNERPKPLALYYFSNSRKKQKEILNKTSSGGACINEVIMHVANSKLPFGGVGNSGLGRYHGKYSFDTFSHIRSIIKKSNIYDPPIRYAPYSKAKFWLVKKILG
ncbi:MAG: aldehyde dehydrogenase [Bacteroidales bacterium]|jgi:aldehyde dehydrogenase (NAD+)|nr:aldehyde dehydrogenase [Bacteroidales bacterium]